MLFKTHLLSLEPDDRAFALVGAFVDQFARLEGAIDKAIGDILHLEGTGRLVMGQNMGFEDKAKVLLSLINRYGQADSRGARFEKAIREALRSRDYWNFVTHSSFTSSDDGDGVEFSASDRTEELEPSVRSWSLDDFLNKIEAIERLGSEVTSVESLTAVALMRRAVARDRNSAACWLSLLPDGRHLFDD